MTLLFVQLTLFSFQLPQMDFGSPKTNTWPHFSFWFLHRTFLLPLRTPGCRNQHFTLKFLALFHLHLPPSTGKFWGVENQHSSLFSTSFSASHLPPSAGILWGVETNIQCYFSFYFHVSPSSFHRWFPGCKNSLCQIHSDVVIRILASMNLGQCITKPQDMYRSKMQENITEVNFYLTINKHSTWPY